MNLSGRDFTIFSLGVAFKYYLKKDRHRSWKCFILLKKYINDSCCAHRLVLRSCDKDIIADAELIAIDFLQSLHESL